MFICRNIISNAISYIHYITLSFHAQQHIVHYEVQCHKYTYWYAGISFQIQFHIYTLYYIIISFTTAYIHYGTLWCAMSYIYMLTCRNIISNIQEYHIIYIILHYHITHNSIYIHYGTFSSTMSYIMFICMIIISNRMPYITRVTLSSTMSYTHVHQQEISFPIQGHILS